MKAFQYEPLDPNPENLMLRRLELLPGTGQIRCKLESVSLNDKPVYEAISYHWGGTAEKYQIVCSSASLTITNSLHSALQLLRGDEELARHLTKGPFMNFRPSKSPNMTFLGRRIRSGKHFRSYSCARGSHGCG